MTLIQYTVRNLTTWPVNAVRTIAGLPGRLHIGRRRPTVEPARTPTDRCAATACKATDNPFSDDPRYLPLGPKQMARCAVPAQAEPANTEGAGLPRATAMVRDARPDLVPVWCAGNGGKSAGAWFHSVCFSTHSH